MTTIFHKFPTGKKVFGIIQPPHQRPDRGQDITVIDPKNPNNHCTAAIVEILQFNITGKLNWFPDWLSLLLFDIDAEPILSHILKKYPDAEKQNQFEIWIVKKT
jgi:hypothetical protein